MSESEAPNAPSSEIDFGSGPGLRSRLVRVHPRTGKRQLDWLTWGLQRQNARPDEPQPLHARAETVAELPIFAEAFRLRRGLMPATNYIQRQSIGRPGRRFTISRRDKTPMAIAALWEAYPLSNGEISRTYCLITVEANATLATIHDRMPLVLEERDWPTWLGEAPGDPATLLRPPGEDVLISQSASRLER
jgi:putative SOS response-associated peptidase YedK